MGAAVVITRTHHSAAALRELAVQSGDTAVARRLLAIAMVLEGASRLEAARRTGMDRQTLRDWAHRYNEEGVAGLASRKAPGAAGKLTPEQIEELRELVIGGPDPKIHKVVRWRCIDLVKSGAAAKNQRTKSEQVLPCGPNLWHCKQAAQERDGDRAKRGGGGKAAERTLHRQSPSQKPADSPVKPWRISIFWGRKLKFLEIF